MTAFQQARDNVSQPVCMFVFFGIYFQCIVLREAIHAISIQDASFSIDKNKNSVNERGHPVKVLIASTALVLVGTITIRRAFAARLTSFCQKLVQTERILSVFLELDWTAARTRSTTAVGSTELLVRNESTADI